MRKKHILLIGTLMLMVFCGIPKKINAETDVVYSIEGTTEFLSTDTNILHNISIPIKLRSGDTLYWYNHYYGECGDLTIIFYLTPTHWTAFYIVLGDNNICEQRKYHNIGNIGTDYGDNTFVIVEKHYDGRGFFYRFDWRFWVEREIVEEKTPNNIIGVDIIPIFLGLMCIGVILISRQIRSK